MERLRLESIFEEENSDILQENANVDGRSPMGQMAKLASESSKWYMKHHILSDEARHMVDENLLYIHDADFLAVGTTTCCQIPLGQLLQSGFNTGHGYMRSPQDIKSAMALSSIILQSNQNMQHGGQAYPMFDYDLAPYIVRTFERNLTRIQSYPTTFTKEQCEEQAWIETERDTYQACEAFVHNANSMHSRGGGQVPFISVNYGTDTSREGRMLTRNLLLATQSGLGHGETPIFPIQVFKVKEGVNLNEGDPNYDLYQLALETTSERLFPNFSFLDAPFNAQYWDGRPESEVAYMGCRTRVMGNIHGEETSIGRGNLSFSTINLVRLALLSTSMDDFWRRLDELVQVGVRQLHDRYLLQCQKKAANFRFLYEQGVWRGGEELNREDTLESILKQGTLSLGFIGMAEALVALRGRHHGECEESRKIGLEIAERMRRAMDEAITTYQLNYSLLATPAEGLSGKFVGADRERFGRLPGITDREYYTNSFHVPVYYKLKAVDKIRIEAPFHNLCNAGHITYVECDGTLRHNVAAIDALVRTMFREGIGYGSINHPVDRCKNCGHSGVIHEACPSCGTDQEIHIERIRRITGYLVGELSRWNSGKRAEERDRVKHS
ncbi:anaerobic ribonucleoside-triphosphate reductase [Paenibacillus selenitireducens]|uniref:Anaerobic ribonucleoside-triphosphate reductase n=1 Tax=Paenibacillus selenitireducens TaxID=1324314 RepID=A0A1T2XBK0_9BACL|nr:anaerobic ribonucleoside triphosphate reductase [Paenibacillus selenitireducens]OPA77003.1 anaerobic ribonucleoside-triphosphate reductase [Paenibacillus selenitireducens]